MYKIYSKLLTDIRDATKQSEFIFKNLFQLPLPASSTQVSAACWSKQSFEQLRDTSPTPFQKGLCGLYFYVNVCKCWFFLSLSLSLSLLFIRNATMHHWYYSFISSLQNITISITKIEWKLDCASSVKVQPIQWFKC